MVLADRWHQGSIRGYHQAQAAVLARRACVSACWRPSRLDRIRSRHRTRRRAVAALSEVAVEAVEAVATVDKTAPKDAPRKHLGWQPAYVDSSNRIDGMDQ